MRRLALLALLSTAVTAGSAQAIRGPTAARLVARIADAPLASDGARWVAFQRSGAQRPTLVDASRGAQRRLPGGCDIADIRRAVFLLRCGPDRRAELLFPDRGRLERPAGARPGDQFEALGRFWIAGWRNAPTQQCPADDSCRSEDVVEVFVNWRTGDRRLCDTANGRSCRFGLDHPTLVRAHRRGRQPRGAVGYQVGAGWATWVTYPRSRPPVLHARSLASGRRWRWLIPSPRAYAVHTARRIFVQTADRLYELPLPASGRAAPAARGRCGACRPR